MAKFRDGDVRAARCDIEPATKELDWRPKWTLEEGLRDCSTGSVGNRIANPSIRTSCRLRAVPTPAISWKVRPCNEHQLIGESPRVGTWFFMQHFGDPQRRGVIILRGHHRYRDIDGKTPSV